MRTGALRNLLTIQRRVQVGVTNLNEPKIVWQDWRVDIACEVEVRRGREHFANNQRYSEEIWRFRIRYDEGVGLDTSMRIQYEGMNFNIKAPLPDAQRRADLIIEATVQDSVLEGASLSIAIEEAIYAGDAGDVYSGFTITAKGGSPAYVFTVDSGALPLGLILDPATGAVSGTPTVAGTSYPTFMVTDGAGDEARLPEIELTVN